MKFIGAHWQTGHILASHRGLLDWQHGDGEEYCYLGAWDGDDLLAVLGYIPTRRYDASLASQDNVLWLALWKLRDDVQVGGLGLRLLSSLATIEPNAAVGVVGINPAHVPMYRALRYEVGELRQFVVFRSGMPLQLASWPESLARPRTRAGEATLRELSAAQLVAIDGELELGNRRASLPRKTGRYFERRYLAHPYYPYRVHAVMLDAKCRGLLASRIADGGSQRALRIVDWFGDPAALTEVGGAVQQLLDESGTEYADLWQAGIPAELLEQSGFVAVDPEGPAIVPTLFEPLVRQNRRIQFAFRARERGAFVIMRADGDQDRPSRLAVAA